MCRNLFVDDEPGADAFVVKCVIVGCFALAAFIAGTGYLIFG